MVLLLAAVPIGGRSSTAHSVEVADYRFTPMRVRAQVGDAIRLVWSSAGHDVEAYGGATFSSGILPEGSSFTASFDGGTIGYRCTPHSSLNADRTVCTGMCGMISDQPPPAPTLTQPTDGEIRGRSATIGGRSYADVEVFDGEVRIAAVVAVTPTWTVTLTFAGGPHALTAVAVAPDGRSEPSAPVRITVDDAPPTVVMTEPAIVALSPFVVRGSASDNLRVLWIEVEARPRLPIGGSQRKRATCTGCGGPSASFEVSFELGPGLYDVIATASDGYGNQASTPPILIGVV